MNEEAARVVVLAQAIETEDAAHQLLSADDRLYASRSARELARWQAANAHQAVDFSHFLQQRAEQLLKRLAERVPGFAALPRAHVPWRILTLLLPLVALLAGFGLDRLGDPHRVDLLSAPLLLILVWNLAVYLAMPVMALLSRPRTRTPTATVAPAVPWLARLRFRTPRKWPAPLAAAVPRFLAQWSTLTAPLSGARVARLWHLGAAAFALGALGSLYLRGVLSQYRTGWESTFLDAAQVHALLGLLFAPALAVFPLQGFSLQDVEALRFTATTSLSAQDASQGARWVHLYAATLLLLVVLPRLLLALWAHVRVRHLARNIPLDLAQPYFLRLRNAAGATAGRLRVLPYSLRVDEPRDHGLTAVAQALLGDEARVVLRPTLAYGEDVDQALQGSADTGAEPTLTAVLFSLAATPEKENHGALLDHLRRALPKGFVVLVDESGLRERMGAGQADASPRLTQRIALWQNFCQHHHCEATIVNLLEPGARPLDGMVAPAGQAKAPA